MQYHPVHFVGVDRGLPRLERWRQADSLRKPLVMGCFVAMGI
jgi:hypothetical protein